MPKFHRIAAFCVMVAAGAWIATGEFSSVGSAQTAEGKESLTTSQPADTVPPMRTVQAVEPVFIDHARAIRLSGITEADKRVELAARADGVIASLAMTKGGTVRAGSEVMTLEGPEAVAQEDCAKGEEGRILRASRRGYKLRDRLLRPASVVVSKLPTPTEGGDA